MLHGPNVGFQPLNPLDYLIGFSVCVCVKGRRYIGNINAIFRYYLKSSRLDRS